MERSGDATPLKGKSPIHKDIRMEARKFSVGAALGQRRGSAGAGRQAKNAIRGKSQKSRSQGLSPVAVARTAQKNLSAPLPCKAPDPFVFLIGAAGGCGRRRLRSPGAPRRIFPLCAAGARLA